MDEDDLKSENMDKPIEYVTDSESEIDEEEDEEDRGSKGSLEFEDDSRF